MARTTASKNICVCFFSVFSFASCAGFADQLEDGFAEDFLGAGPFEGGGFLDVVAVVVFAAEDDAREGFRTSTPYEWVGRSRLIVFMERLRRV